MLERLLDPIFAPFRQAWAKFMGAKNVVDGAAGDIQRLKQLPKQLENKAKLAKQQAQDLGKKAKGARDAAKSAAGKAKGAYGQAQGAAAQAQGYMGGGPGAPPPPGMQGAPNFPPGMPQPGMPPGMPQPGMPPGMPYPGMPQPGMPPGMGPGMPPGMAARPGMPPGPMGAAMGGSPQMGGYAMGGPPMGAAPMGSMPMGGPPGPGNRTMAIMAGGTAGAAIGWLVPIKGPLRGELITLKPISVIGKDPTCDVVFNDPFLSGRHATIRAQNGLFVLEDHSTNGTFVNDRKVQRHELVDNDFVKLGQTMMKFKAL